MSGRFPRVVGAMLGVALLATALAACGGPNSERRMAQFLGGGKETDPRSVAVSGEPDGRTGLALSQPPVSGEIGTPQSDQAEGPSLGGPELYPGAGFAIQPAQQTNPITLSDGGDITLNFVNADIREVVDTILGATLKLNFAIDPRVQGVVTLRTASPVPRAQALGVLEDILALSGVALVESGGLYKVVPIADAAAAPEIMSDGSGPVRLQRGFGLHVIPLRFASAAALREVTQAFVPPGRVLRIDAARNLMVFVGPAAEAKDIEALIATFDVDWMAGMSFALLPVSVADPEAMAAELEKIFAQEEGGALAGLLQFLPIKRLSAVLVISSQAAYLDDARSWVARLDRGQEGDRRKLYVYYVQNGRSGELADILGQVFGVRTSTAEREQSPELAPGLTPTEIGAAGFSSGSTSGTGVDYSGTGGTPTLGTDQPLERPSRGVTSRPASSTGTLGAAEGVRIVADQRNNALVIYATPAEYQSIAAALEKLDIVPLQVMIEATIAEVTLNDTLRYGVEWFFSSGNNRVSFSTLTSGAISSLFPGFSYLFANDDVSVVINALSRVTDVKVISSPQLMVLDNEKARLQVGDQVPIVTRTAVSVDDPTAPIASEIEYRDTGVILDIIPRVNASGLVVLDITQEVSDVALTDSSQIDSPTIQQRRITSTVAINSGETVALGGLIRDINDNSVSGVPLISEIPILGNLFKSTSDVVRRTELLVLLTPRVVRDRMDARIVTDDLRKRLRALPPLVPKIQ